MRSPSCGFGGGGVFPTYMSLEKWRNDTCTHMETGIRTCDAYAGQMYYRNKTASVGTSRVQADDQSQQTYTFDSWRRPPKCLNRTNSVGGTHKDNQPDFTKSGGDGETESRTYLNRIGHKTNLCNETTNKHGSAPRTSKESRKSRKPR